MANEEHLTILKQGVEVWNKWRKDNKQIIPVLSEVNLSKENLCGADRKIAVKFPITIFLTPSLLVAL